MNLFSILLGKLIILLTRILGLGAGATWPGEIILRLNKNFLKKMSAKLPNGIIVISGTNGKTTTSAMVSSILIQNNLKVLNNPSGANLLNGIASAFIKDAKLNGKLKSNVAVLEIDEANLPQVIKQINPNIILLLNLSRDQLDRYGEVEIILEKWVDAINNSSDKTKIIINNEDGRLIKIPDKIKNEVIYFSDPINQNWPCNLPGRYNKLNTLAAVEVVKLLNIPFNIIQTALKNFKPAFGRGEKFIIDKKIIKIFLAKNPASFNANLEMILDKPLPPPSLPLIKGKENHQSIQHIQSILFILNDNIPDGRDVSWIFDINPEQLKKVCENKKIFISGTRHYDMALCLKYAGVNCKNFWCSSDIKKMIETMIQQMNEGELGLILPTYSAMLESRKVLVGRKIL